MLHDLPAPSADMRESVCCSIMQLGVSSSGNAEGIAAFARQKRPPLRPSLVLHVPARSMRRVDRTAAQAVASEQDCRILESAAKTCHARIAITPEGSRGLVATAPIKAWQRVVELQDTDILTVPADRPGSSAEGLFYAGDDCWHGWVQQWQQVHGTLPIELVSFLADALVEPKFRLAAWLLYLKQQSNHAQPDPNNKHCDSKSNTGSTVCNCDNIPSHGQTPISSLWQSYIAVLPASAELTNVSTGLWSQAELNQLEPRATRETLEVMLQVMQNGERAFRLLQSDSRVAVLKLANTRQDAAWATSIIATRSLGDHHLAPLVCMANHKEDQGANCILNTRTVLTASTDIPEGAELAYTYMDKGFYRTPNMELLWTWGFTLSPKRGDWVFAWPLQYGVLPPICWPLALQAAAAVSVTQQGRQLQQPVKKDMAANQQLVTAGIGRTRSSSSCSSSINSQDSKGSNSLKVRIVNAAAHLPLCHLPPHQDLQTNEVANAHGYAQAATQWVALAEQQYIQQQQQHQLPFRSIEHNKVCAGRDIEFASHLDAYCSMKHKGEKSPVLADMYDADVLEVQRWVAEALCNACLGMIAGCKTTIEQDIQLLQALQQQQQHGEHVEDQDSRLGSKVQRQQQQSGRQQPRCQAPQPWQQQEHWQAAVSEFEGLQRQVLHRLALMQAYRVVNKEDQPARLSDSAYVGHSTEADESREWFALQLMPASIAFIPNAVNEGSQTQQFWTAHTQWAAALAGCFSDIAAGKSEGGFEVSRKAAWDLYCMCKQQLRQELPRIFASQKKLLYTMQCLQQQLGQHQVDGTCQLIETTGSSSNFQYTTLTSSFPKQECAASTADQQQQRVSTDRLTAAVAAWLEQKRLLAVAAELCQEIDRLCQ